MTFAAYTKQRKTCAGILNKDALRRLIVAMIAETQKPMIAQGAIRAHQNIRICLTRITTKELDQFGIDEPHLGLDSLARLDIIMMVNKFFALHTSGIEDYLLSHPTIGQWVYLLQRHLEMAPSDLSLTFTSAGSTGQTTSTAHPMSELVQEVEAIKTDAFASSPTHGRILSLVDPHHIYGFLFTCLLPKVMQRDVIAVAPENPSAVLSKARSDDIIIATPFTWEKIAQTGRLFTPDVHGVTAGAPSNTATWGLVQKSGLKSMTEFYGATETGGIGLRGSPDVPLALLSHLTKRSGKIYRDHSGDPLDLQDTLEWLSEDLFTVIGRRDKMLQVAGVNVCPVAIARQIETLPTVATATVRPAGSRLKAFIVLAEPPSCKSTVKEEIFSKVLKDLAPAARPVSITFGDALPTNSVGKLTDWVPAVDE